jgi:hypothetical protein
MVFRGRRGVSGVDAVPNGLLSNGKVVATLYLLESQLVADRDRRAVLRGKQSERPSWELDAPQTQVPHSGQTHRVTTPSLSAARWIARGSIPVRRKAPSFTTIANGEGAAGQTLAIDGNGTCRPTVALR